MVKSKLIQIISESIILILSTLWFIATREYSPLVGIIGSLTALIISITYKKESSSLLNISKYGNLEFKNIDSIIFDNLNDSEIIKILTKNELSNIDKIRKKINSKNKIELKDKKELQENTQSLQSKKKVIQDILNTYRLRPNGNLPEEYIKSFELFFRGDFSEALKLLDNINISKYKKLNSINFLLKANISLMLSDFKNSELYYLQSIKLYPSWEGLFQLASLYSYIGKKGEAIVRYKQSLKHTNNIILLAYTKDLIGIIYSNKNEFKKSQKYYISSLKSLDKCTNTDSPEFIQRISSVYNNYGILQLRLGNNKKALNCFEKSLLKLELLKKGNFLMDNELILLLNNLALIDKENSVKYFTRALDLIKNLLKNNNNIEHKHSFSLIASNIGIFKAKEFKYTEALKFYNKALSLLLEIVDRSPYEYRVTLAACYYNLGHTYNEMEELEKSKKCYHEAIINYEKILYTNLVYEIEGYKKSINALAFIYIEERNFIKAQKLHQKLYNYYSSINIQSKHLVYEIVVLVNNFANICCENKEFNKASDLYNEALKYSKEYVNVDPSLFLPYLELTLRHLAILYEQINKKIKAENFYQESLKVKIEIHKHGYTILDIPQSKRNRI